MKVFINGEVKEFTAKINLQELVENLALSSDKIAVELNKLVVRKKDWENTALGDSDKIEIIHFVGGG